MNCDTTIKSLLGINYQSHTNNVTVVSVPSLNLLFKLIAIQNALCHSTLLHTSKKKKNKKITHKLKSSLILQYGSGPIAHIVIDFQSEMALHCFNNHMVQSNKRVIKSIYINFVLLIRHKMIDR